MTATNARAAPEASRQRGRSEAKRDYKSAADFFRDMQRTILSELDFDSMDKAIVVLLVDRMCRNETGEEGISLAECDAMWEAWQERLQKGEAKP